MGLAESVSVRLTELFGLDRLIELMKSYRKYSDEELFSDYSELHDAITSYQDKLNQSLSKNIVSLNRILGEEIEESQLSDVERDMKDWSVQWLEERREDIRKLEDVYDTINYHVYKYLLRRYAPETKIR